MDGFCNYLLLYYGNTRRQNNRNRGGIAQFHIYPPKSRPIIGNINGTRRLKTMNSPAAATKPRNSGFTLLELSIVLTIVGILLYGTLSVGLAQIDIGKVKSTQDKLDKINNAITVYYKVNGYLPCPANGADTAAGNPTTYGLSQISGATCTTGTSLLRDSGTTVYVGTLPSRSLNLPDDYMLDSWGDRITYGITKSCISASNWNYITAGATSGTKFCAATAGGTELGAITINDGNGTAWPNKATYIVISHGKNGIGAWIKSGSTTRKTGTSCSTAEEYNANMTTTGCGTSNGATAANTTYYDAQYNDGTKVVAGVPVYYDDLVRWRASAQIDYDANH